MRISGTSDTPSPNMPVVSRTGALHDFIQTLRSSHPVRDTLIRNAGTILLTPNIGVQRIAHLRIRPCTTPVRACPFIGYGIGRNTLSIVTFLMLAFFTAMIISVLRNSY